MVATVRSAGPSAVRSSVRLHLRAPIEDGEEAMADRYFESRLDQRIRKVMPHFFTRSGLDALLAVVCERADR